MIKDKVGWFQSYHMFLGGRDGRLHTPSYWLSEHSFGVEETVKCGKNSVSSTKCDRRYSPLVQCVCVL